MVELDDMTILADSGNNDDSNGNNDGGGDNNGGGGGGDDCEICLYDWGTQGGLAPGSDGSPGYDIYRAPQQSEESTHIDGVLQTRSGWNILFQPNMDYGYLNSLPYNSSTDGIIGIIKQETYSLSCSNDGSGWGTIQKEQTDYFKVVCETYRSQVREMHSNRNYRFPVDIFLLSDANFRPGAGYDPSDPDAAAPLYKIFTILWGESTFIPNDGLPPNKTTVRYLAVATNEFYGSSFEDDFSSILYNIGF